MKTCREIEILATLLSAPYVMKIEMIHNLQREHFERKTAQAIAKSRSAAIDAEINHLRNSHENL